MWYNKPLPNEKFLERIKNIFGNTLIYTHVDYKGYTQKVILECPIHGKFEKVARLVLRRQGCPKCGNARSGSRIKPQEKIIERFKKVHGDKYDYSKCVYINCRTKMLIICNKCKNPFEESSSYHTNKHRGGCPTCNNLRSRRNFEHEKKYAPKRKKRKTSVKVIEPELILTDENSFQGIPFYL